jgi:antitoxin (DNA-binding transcriptional repressor) of toxin-antitoxin stability system
MTTIPLETAQKELPALIRRVLAGEEVVIVADECSVQLRALPAAGELDEARARSRGYGCMKGQFEVTDAFFEPLGEDEMAAWEGHPAK